MPTLQRFIITIIAKCPARAVITGITLLVFLSAAVSAQRPELIIPATHQASSVVISANEKWLVSAGGDGIKIWENTTGSLIKNLRPGGQDNLRFNSGRITMCIDKGSTLLAMQVADTIYVFDFDKFIIRQKIKATAGNTAMVFSADGKSLFAAGESFNAKDNYLLQKINIIDNSQEQILQIKILTLASHSIGQLVVNPVNTNEILMYDAVMGSWMIDVNLKIVKKQFKEEGRYVPVAYQPNGNLLVIAGKAERILYIAEVDAKTYTQVKRSKTIFTSVEYFYSVIVFNTGTNKLMLMYEDNYSIVNTASFVASVKTAMPKTNDYIYYTDKSIAISPSGNSFIRGATMTRLSATGEQIQKYGETPLDSYVQFNFKNKDAVALKDRNLVFENGNFLVQLVDTAFKSDFSGFIYRVTADGKTGFLYEEEQGLLTFDPTKSEKLFTRVGKVNDRKKKFAGMQIFDKLNLLAMIGNDGIYVMDLKTLKLLYIVDIPYGLAYNSYERLNKFCDISGDNSKMILFAEAKEDTSSFIYCVDLSDKNEKWKYESVNIHNLRFVNNDQQLLFTSRGKLVYLDAETGKVSGMPILLADAENETIISPSGAVAATKIAVDANVSAGSNIGLIDIVNNKPIGTIKGTGDEVNGFVFLHNQRYLLTEEYGGLCIWDIDKKRKIAKIYMFEKTGDWVMVTDDGRFDATAGALKKMYFTKGKDIIPLESLYEKYFVPGLLRQIWDNNLPDNVPDINTVKSPPTVKISSELQQRNLEVDNYIKTVKTDKELVTIKVTADGIDDVVAEIRLYQNGKLVNSTRNLSVEDDTKGDKLSVRTFNVTLNAGKNSFKAIAINSQRTESVADELVAEYTPVNVQPLYQIQLHVLVVGVNTYKNPKYSLNYAQADATAFAAALKDGSQGLFSKVNTTFLRDAEATKEGITAAFEKVKKEANPQDLFVFYYAGHGVINDKKEFFLVPYDVTQLYGADDALAQKGVSAAVLQQMSKEIKAQKQLFILDACQSAGALQIVASTRGAAEEQAIAQLARSTGTQWLTASGSEQFASEFQELGHGSFTYCLLEAFKGTKGQAAKRLTVKELDAYLQTKVPEITKQYKGTPQYPASYSYGNDFPIIIIK